jgi:hypothetical protein
MKLKNFQFHGLIFDLNEVLGSKCKYLNYMDQKYLLGYLCNLFMTHLHLVIKNLHLIAQNLQLLLT